MSGNYEQTIIVGNVGREPEMRYTPSGTAVTSFSVAVNSQYGDKKTTKWYKVSAWGKQAEICHEYVKKGMSVLVEGVLVADSETGAPRIWKKKDGTPQTAFEINASAVRFLGNGKQYQGMTTEDDGKPIEEEPPF